MFGIEYDESLGYWENQVLDGVAIVVGIPVLPFVLVAEVFGWKILDAPSASDCKSRAQTQDSPRPPQQQQQQAEPAAAAPPAYSAERRQRSGRVALSSQDKLSLKLQEGLEHSFNVCATPEQANGSPDQEVWVPMKNFRFWHQPQQQRQLLQVFKLSPVTLKTSLTSGRLSWMRSPGKSGCGFFQSDDKRLMLKTISRTELRVMQERLGEYIAHCKAHPGTLLARVYGLFQLTQRQGLWRKRTCFILMGNVCPGQAVLGLKTRLFDLKGSTFARQKGVGPGAPSPETTCLQDLDLLATNFGLRLSSSCHSSLWRQAACDAGLLERWRVQDYSLLLCMQWVPGRPAPAVTPQSRSERGIAVWGASRDQAPGEEQVLVSFGMVDFLQVWTRRRRLEKMIKGLWCDTRFTSVQPPDQYADRWLQRFMALFSAPRCAGCRAARHDLLEHPRNHLVDKGCKGCRGVQLDCAGQWVRAALAAARSMPTAASPDEQHSSTLAGQGLRVKPTGLEGRTSFAKEYDRAFCFSAGGLARHDGVQGLSSLCMQAFEDCVAVAC